MINAYEEDMIFKMKEAGLDQNLYAQLILSYKEKVHDSLTNPIPFYGINDKTEQEEFKYVYRYREYFKTLEYPHSDITAWLLMGANETLTRFGTTFDSNKHVLDKFEIELNALKKEDDEDFFDFFTLLFGKDEHTNES